MPSKKKLRKRMQTLKRHCRAWEGAVNQRDRELKQLRDAARDLVHACDQLDLGTDTVNKVRAVRELLPGEPWTLERLQELRNRWRAVPRGWRTDVAVASTADAPDWAKTIHNGEPHVFASGGQVHDMEPRPRISTGRPSFYVGDRIGPEHFQDPDNPPGDFEYVPEKLPDGSWNPEAFECWTIDEHGKFVPTLVAEHPEADCHERRDEAA